MNNTVLSNRIQNQVLIIVEGKTEKDSLFPALFKSFPELDIQQDRVWMYGTNIYLLYQEILNEYGEDWEDQEVDLPFLISRKQGHVHKSSYMDFTTILLVFDYERQDPNFSEEVIIKLQHYFQDSTDVGQLYINYPMLESYLHFYCFPDPDYKTRRISASIRRGKEYKSCVRNSIVERSMAFPSILEKKLSAVLGIEDATIRDRCTTTLLLSDTTTNLSERIEAILTHARNDSCATTGRESLRALFKLCSYVDDGIDYWKYLRNIFTEIIRHNICKASFITNGRYEMDNDDMRIYFKKLDHEAILNVQNNASHNRATGDIWVLNTCLFFIADYNFTLVLS